MSNHSRRALPLSFLVCFSMALVHLSASPAGRAVAADEAPPAAAATPAGPADAPVQTPTLKYDLKYKFTPGETLRTEIIHRAKVLTTIQGSSQTAETQSTSIKAWKVDGVTPEGTVTFVHMIESIDMWQRTQGRTEVRYNSAEGGEVPPGYEEVAKAVGVPLSSVTMSNRGTIIKRRETSSQPLATSTQMTLPFPKEPVAIGETWSSPVDIDVTLPDGGFKKIQTRQKFTLESVVDDMATIKVDSQILTPINDPAIEAQLVQRLSEGHVKFDIATGRVVSQQLDLDKHVIGFSGTSSSMHYVNRFTEKLLPAEQTAKAAATKASAANANGGKATQAKATQAKAAAKGTKTR